MARLAAWLVAHGRLVVAAVLGVTLVFAVFAARLEFDFHPGDLLPQGHPFMEVHNRFHENFGEANVLTVMVEARSGTIFTPEVLSTIFRVTEAVDRLPGVNHDQIDSLASRFTRVIQVQSGGRMTGDPVMSGPVTSTEEAKQIEHQVLASGYILGNLVSLDERAAVVRAGFPEHRLDARRLFTAVNQTILPLANEYVTVSVAGPPRQNGWVLALQWQVLLAFAGAVVLTWILLYRYFRDWRGALRPTISGGLAAIWGFGLVQLSGFALNPLTLVIPFLITARAVSHSAQMHDRYYEELAAGVRKEDAVQRSFTRLAAPTIAGIMTDALGVLAIAIVAIPALRALALTATLWLLSLIVTELLLNPIVYRHLRAPEVEVVRAREGGLLARACRRLAAAVTGPRGRWVALFASGALAGIGALLIPRLQIGDPGSASRILAANSEFNRSHRAVQEKFGGSEPFVVIVEGDAPRALYRPALLRAMEDFQRELMRLPMVGYSISPVDIMKGMRERFNELEPKWGVIPSTEREVAETFFTYWGFIPPSTSARFFTPDFKIGQLTFFCSDHSVQTVRSVVAAAQHFIATHPLEGAHFRLAGGLIGVMAAVYDEILRSDALMTAAAFGVIFVITLVTYRSLAAALLLILPLVLANAVVNGYMAARGIGLDLDTLPVIAVGVGFGIDYGIYILSRVQERTGAGMPLDDAVREAIAGAGRTVAFTAIAMTAGVLCFTLTELRFVGEMAVLLALWMATSAATALVTLPAALVVVRPRFLDVRRAASGEQRGAAA
jgi:predicted RND superfamily exporter protein